MHTFTNKMFRMLLVLGMIMAGLALIGSPAKAAAVSINLCASTGTATMPGAVSVPIWGFNLGACGAAVASLPGPVLVVNEGDTVTVNVTNNLPAGHDMVFEIPGIAFVPGPNLVAVGSTVTFNFTATAPGSYIYESGGNGGRQEAMGLYGALVVRSLTAGRAYDTDTTAFDSEAVLVLSQIDPLFNAAPDSFNMNNYLATYWLINGKAYPDTAPIGGAAGQRVLLRYLNAGYDNTTMMLLGMHEQVLARDARLLNNPFLADAETIPAGGTEDAIATVPASAAPSASGFPLYNRQLHVTNGDPAAPNHAQGGMLTFISASAPVVVLNGSTSGSGSNTNGPAPSQTVRLFVPVVNR